MLMQNGDQTELCNSLHSAASNGESEVVAAMLQMDEVKLAVNSQNLDAQTPLHMASRGRSLETMRVLLEHGADINARAPCRPDCSYR